MSEALPPSEAGTGTLASLEDLRNRVLRLGNLWVLRRNCLALDPPSLLMDARSVLGLHSCGGGDPGAFPLELCTSQCGSSKNLGHLLDFIASALSSRDKGIKGMLTSSLGRNLQSSLCIVSFSVSSGT